MLNKRGYKIVKIYPQYSNSNLSEELNQKHINNLMILLNREKLLKKFKKNCISAELGVDKGNFSEKIIKYTNPKKLYLIDTWKNENKMNFVKNKFKNEIEKRQVYIIRGRSEEVLKKFEDGFFDWIYIDTSHAYQQTVKELELSRQKVKEGGVIAGHDYCMGNIERALPYGVVQAVNEFCVKYNWKFIYLTHETRRNLSFAIKKISSHS